jgi:hypothetical protein
MCGGQDAGNAGRDGGGHVPHVRGGHVLGVGGKRRVCQLRARQVSGDGWERCRVGLRALHCGHILCSGRGKRRIGMPKLSLGGKLCGG